jgi:16S rRNA (cytosine1407-C5)-methyltransferase
MPLPSLFLDRLKNILPAGHDLEHCFLPPQKKSFRINTLKARPQDIKEQLSSRHVEFEEVPWYPAAVLVPASMAGLALDTDLHREGKIYAQGLESMLAVMALDPQPGETVLDLCAAPGSKTTQIAAHMGNHGRLIANEPVRGRFFRLKAVVELLGAQAELKMADGRRFNGHSEAFDRILVDAPCSSEGRFGQDDPKSYAYWSVRKIHEMAHKQKGLLLHASRLLKPGGVLVYATCTFAPEENEAAVDWLLRKAEGRLSLEPVAFKDIPDYPALTAWNGRPFDERTSGCLRVLPAGPMEGFFIARFKCLE